MKKIFLTLLILIAVININSCKKDENQASINENGLNIKTFVNSHMGLVLRAGPDVSTEALANVPYKEQVIIIRYSDKDGTVSRITAPWAYVKYRHLKGWLFSGYLIGELRTGNFKNHDLGKLIQTVSAAYKMNYKGKTFNTPDQITVRQIEGDLCVVGCYAMDSQWEGPVESVALWYFKNGKWNDFDILNKQSHSNYPDGLEIKLLYLNPDEFVDVVSRPGVVASMDIYVYLNDGNNLNRIEEIDTSTASLFENNGICGSRIIRIDDMHNKGDKITMKFNCRTNKYDIIKKEWLE